MRVGWKILVGCVLFAGLGCGGSPRRADAPPATDEEGFAPFRVESAPERIDVSREVAEGFRLLNEERLRHGLRPFRWDDGAALAARRHGEDMARRSYFDHECPDGRGVMHRVSAAGVRGYRAVGENLALGQRTGAAVVASWMASPGHRANMLKDSFEGAGLALTPSPAGPLWVLVLLTR